MATGLVLALVAVSGTAARATGTIIKVTSTLSDTGGPECKLRDAMSAANGSTIAGGCDGSGSPPFVIELEANAYYFLKYLDNNSSLEGPYGLPRVTSDITINGHEAIIERHFAFNDKVIPFRFFQV